MVFTPRFRGRPRARGGGVGSISFAPKGPGPQQFNEQNVNKGHDRNLGGFSGAKNDAPATSAESLRITVGNEIYRERQEYQQHGPVNERLGPPVHSQNRGDGSRINQYGRGDYPNDQYRQPDRGPDTDRHWDHNRQQLDRDFKSIDYGHGRDKHGDVKNQPESMGNERVENRDFKQGGTAQGFNAAPAQSVGQRYSVSLTPGGSMNAGSAGVQKFSASETHSNAAQQRPLKSILKKVGDSGLQSTTQSQPPTQTHPVPGVSAVPGNTPVPEVNINYSSLPGISNYMEPDDEKFLYGNGSPGSNFAQKTGVTSTVYESVSSFVSQQRNLSDKLTVNSSNLLLSNMSSTNTVSGHGAGVSYGSSQQTSSMTMNRAFGQGPQERAGGNFIAGNQLSEPPFNSGLSNIGQNQQSLFPVQNQPKLQPQQSQAAPLQRVGGGSGGEGSDFWGMLAKSLQTVKETQCNQGQAQIVKNQTGSTASAAQTFIQGGFSQQTNQDGRNPANMFGNQMKLGSQSSLFPSGVQGQVTSTQEQAANTSQLPQTSGVVDAKSKEDYDPTIENILKSIGFDFDMSKRMQEKAKQTKTTDVVKLEETQFGINQTASFLGGTDLSPAEMKSQLFDRGRGKDYRQSSLKEADDSRRYTDDDVEKMIREAQETVRQAKRDLNSREMSALKYINEASPIPLKDAQSPREIQRRKIIESVSKAYDIYERINSPDRFGGGFENNVRLRYDSSSQDRFSPIHSPEKWSPRRSKSLDRRKIQVQHNYRSPDESTKRLMTEGRRSVSIERQSGSAGRKSWSKSPPRKRSRSGSKGRGRKNSRSFDRQSPSQPLGRRSRSRSRGRQSWTRSLGQRSRSRSFGRRSRSPGRLSWSSSRSRSRSRSRMSPEKQNDTIFESQPPQSFQPYQGDNPPQGAYTYPNTSQPYGHPMPIGQPYGHFPFGPGYGPPPGYGPLPPGYGPPPGFGPPPMNQGYGPPHSGGGFQGPPPGFGPPPPPPGVPGYGPPPGYMPKTLSKASQKATGESAPSRTLLYPPIEDKDDSLNQEPLSLSLDKQRNSQDFDAKSPSKEKSSKDIDASHSSKDMLSKKEESSNRTVLPPKSEYHRTVIIRGPRVKKDDEKAKDTTKQITSSKKVSPSVSKDHTAGSDSKPTAQRNSEAKPSKIEGAIDKELQKELEGRHKLLAALQKELERLKKQQNELMRQKRRQKDGHKDPVLLQNSQLQEEIMKQIEKIKSNMSSSQGFSKDIGKVEDSKKKEADSKKKPEDLKRKDTEPRKRSIEYRRKDTESRRKDTESRRRDTESRKKDTETKKRDTETKKRDTDTKKKDSESKKETELSKKDGDSSSVKDIKAAEKDNEKPVLEFYDGGNHWCKLCNDISSNLVEYFQHLRTQKHLQNAANLDRPWVPDSLKTPKKKLMTLKSLLTPFAGVEFLMAADAFYCSLCHEFAGDVNCSAAHLESEIHYKNYQKHCEENPLYEKRMMLDRATAVSLKKAEESKKRKLESSAKENNEKKPKLDSESESTVPKVEETVKSDIEMKRAGFGKFKWEKQDSNSSEKTEMEVEEEEVQLPPAPPSGGAQPQKSKTKISINLQFKGGIKPSPPVAGKASVLPPWQPVSKKSELKASPASKPVEIFPLRKKADVEPPPLDMFLSVEGTESKVPVIETKKKVSAKEILEAFTGKYKEKVEKAAENARESKDQRSNSQSYVAESEDQSQDSEDKSSTTVTMTLSSQEEEADMILMGIDPKSSQPLATIKPPPPVSQNMNLPIKDSRASSSAKEMYGIFFDDEVKESGKVEVSVEFKQFDINESFMPTSSLNQPQETSEMLAGKVQTESIVTEFSLDDVPLPVGDGPSQNSEQGPNEDSSDENRRNDTISPQVDVKLVSEMSDKQVDLGTSVEIAGEQYSEISEEKTAEQQGMDESINSTESAVGGKETFMCDEVAEPIAIVDSDNNKSKEVAGDSEKSIEMETSLVEAKEDPITAVKHEPAANQTETKLETSLEEAMEDSITAVKHESSANQSETKLETSMEEAKEDAITAINHESAANQSETKAVESSKPVEESTQVVSVPHDVHNEIFESVEDQHSEVTQMLSGPLEKEVDVKEMTPSQTTDKSEAESTQDQAPVVPSKRTATDDGNITDIPFKQSKIAEMASTQEKDTNTVQTPSPKKPPIKTKGKRKKAGSKVPQAAEEEVKPTKPNEKPSPSKSDSIPTTMSPGTNTRPKRGAASKETTPTEPRRTTRASTRATRSSTRLAQAEQKDVDISMDEVQTEQKGVDISMDEVQTAVDSGSINEQDIEVIIDEKSVSPSIAENVGNKDIISATSVSDKNDTDAGKKSVDKQTLSPEKEGQTESDNVTKSEDTEAPLDATVDDADSDCSGISLQLGSDFEVVDQCED